MTDHYIEKLEQVYRIKGTRVALDSVITSLSRGSFSRGRSPEAIQDAFPALSLSQVYAAIANSAHTAERAGTYLLKIKFQAHNYCGSPTS